MQIEGKNARKTQSEVNDYRELYAVLVYDLWRNPVEAIQMMAIWICLERIMVLPDLTRKILTLSLDGINKVGDEALSCWLRLDNVNLLFSFWIPNFPSMKSLLEKDIPIELFSKRREDTIVAINEVIHSVCATCLKDIWDGAIARNAYLDFSQRVGSHEVWVSPQKVDIQQEERSLFITFSREYPVAEWEVREFFNMLFDECIESFYMPEVAEGQHPLFAKIVLHHISYIHAILIGGTNAECTINEKPVWMRKFVSKRQRELRNFNIIN